MTAAVAAVAFVGCGPKNTPASAVRPAEVKAGDALNDGKGGPGSADVQCTASDDDAPLIIDLDGKDRKLLSQLVAKKQVPVVAYDCKTLKVLEKCEFIWDSGYEYRGATVQKRVRTVDNAESLSAEVPLGAAGGIKGRVASGQKVDIALAEVGTRAPAGRLEYVARPRLKEVNSGDCATATHFVYALDLGAFAIAQNTKGEASAAAQVFTAAASGDSKSNVTSAQSEGKIDACDQAKDDDKEAPDGCRIPLRIHLRALSKDEKEGEEAENKATQSASKTDADDKPKLAEKPCPEGTVRSEGGACVPPSDKIRFQCRPDVDECKTQCDKGHLGSCEKLGFMLLWPPYKDGKPQNERDPKGAIAALQKACDITKKDGEFSGCGTLASAYRYATFMPAAGSPPPTDNDKKSAYDKGVAVLDYACKRGDKSSCSGLGFQYEYGLTPIVQPDVDRAVHFYKRACEIGYEFACLSAARLYMDGKKDRDGKEIFHREPDQALSLLDQRCKESSSLACSQLASYLTTDKYKVKDLKRAAGIFQLLCDRKNNTGCAENALLQVSATGKPDPKVDLKQARSTLEGLCFDTNNSSACYGVALLKETGKGGTPQDQPKALDYYKKYSYVKDAAARAAHLLEAGGHGVTKDLTAAENFYRQACLGYNNSDAGLCMHAANLAEKSQPGSGRYYFSAACRLGDKAGCAKEKAAIAAAQKPHPPTPPGPPKK